ncbi:MAG: hypothetical protein QF570_12345 [Myxococcota bacterium]|jgi:hypothetical protein|nr:hypothetical protein [Myxococcota bacterium]
MNIGAVGADGLPQSIQTATIKKAHDAVKVEGEAATKLLEGAAQVAKHANSDPVKGRIIDVHA